jgi:hypothetical protein
MRVADNLFLHRIPARLSSGQHGDFARAIPAQPNEVLRERAPTPDQRSISSLRGFPDAPGNGRLYATRVTRQGAVLVAAFHNASRGGYSPCSRHYRYIR